MPEVDLVVLWVDGSDPAWQAEKRKYENPDDKVGNAYFHFRDFNLMKYWFRAIESFIPWFRKIHFVTWGHLPSFLDTSNPKLNIVLHQDFMPEGTLPCFNSTALEMNLFRIRDLAEHFIYFNDDVFVLRPMKKTDFFTKDGLPCCQFTEMPPIPRGTRGPWQMHYVNGMSVINQHFRKRESQKGNFRKFFSLKYDYHDNVRSLAMKLLFPDDFVGFKTFHVASSFRKDTFVSIWEKEPKLLSNVSHHKFREYTDVNQWLAIWWQMAEGNFYPRRMYTNNFAVNQSSVDIACSLIKKQAYEMICLNDGVTKGSNFDEIVKKLQSAFDAILPNSCSFEQ